MAAMTQRVLITGGTGGLGLHVTQAFLGTGASLIVTVENEGQRRRLADAVGDDLGRIQTPQVDLTDEDGVRAVIDDAGPLHAVVHLVGGFAMGELDTAELSSLRAQLELNVVTGFLVLKHALRVMKPAGHGRIVTVGSKAVLDPPGSLPIYAAAKAALVAMTRAAAAETVGTDITANYVLPSVIDTPANRAAMGDAQADRWVRPERLAETILFLCSDAAGDLRGSGLHTFASS